MIYAYSPVCRISRSLPTGQLPYTVHATKFRLVLEVFVKRMEQYQHGCATVSVLETWAELVRYVHCVLVHATQRQPGFKQTILLLIQDSFEAIAFHLLLTYYC